MTSPQAIRFHSMTSTRTATGERQPTLLLGGLMVLISMLGVTQATNVDRRLSTIANPRPGSVQDVASNPTIYTERVWRMTEAEARARYDVPERPRMRPGAESVSHDMSTRPHS